MTPRICLLLAVLTGVPGLARAETDPDIYPERPGTCEPGYQIVEEICYREVCRKVCRIEPNERKIKAPCYYIKCEPICKLKCGCGDPYSCKQGCEKCDCYPKNEYDAYPGGCNKCRDRRILMKREVEIEHHHFKCVAENVVDVVPYMPTERR